MSISEHPVTPPGSSNGEDEIARHLEGDPATLDAIAAFVDANA